MAKRYRYSFAKKKEASKGKLSAALAGASLLLFLAAVLIAFLTDRKTFGFLYGSVSLFAMLLSLYGFVLGLSSFSEQDRKHHTSIAGSISNGIILVVWIALFLMGLD